MTWPYPAGLEIAVREVAEQTGIPLKLLKATVDRRIRLAVDQGQPPIRSTLVEVVRRYIEHASQERSDDA